MTGMGIFWQKALKTSSLRYRLKMIDSQWSNFGRETVLARSGEIDGKKSDEEYVIVLIRSAAASTPSKLALAFRGEKFLTPK